MSLHEHGRLTDGVIVLRPLRLNDAASLLVAINETSAELSRWMTWYHGSYAQSHCEEFLRASEINWMKDESYCFGIFDPVEERLMGTVALNRVERASSTAHLGYWVRRSEAGKGLATRAARLAAAFGRTEMGLRRIRVIVPEGNVASARVAEKCGARLEALVPGGVTLGGKAHDAAVYSIGGAG